MWREKFFSKKRKKVCQLAPHSFPHVGGWIFFLKLYSLETVLYSLSLYCQRIVLKDSSFPHRILQCITFLCFPCGIYACILLPWINMVQCTLDSFLRLRLIFGTHHCSLPPLPLPFHTRSERGKGIKQDKSTSCPSYLTQPPFSPPPPDRLSPTNRPTTILIPPSHSLVYSPKKKKTPDEWSTFPLSSLFLLLTTQEDAPGKIKEEKTQAIKKVLF